MRSNIAAEARAKIVYERLLNFTTDTGTRDALQFLMTREITHMRTFSAALESLGKDPFSIGRIPPRIVDQYFNESTDAGDDGDIDARGPWNEGELELVDSPAISQMQRRASSSSATESGKLTSAALDVETLEPLLIDQMMDVLDAKNQLVEALPSLVEAARSDSLRNALEQHLEETRTHVERLNEAFALIGHTPEPERCRGMARLLEEGNDELCGHGSGGAIRRDLIMFHSLGGRDERRPTAQQDSRRGGSGG